MSDGPEVLDASALLAFLRGDVDDDAVALDGAVLSAVNLAEVVRRSAAHGAETETLLEELLLLGLEVAPFGPEEALAAGRIEVRSRGARLPFGARACLATAQVRGGTAVTTDAQWRAWGVAVPLRIVP